MRHDRSVPLSSAVGAAADTCGGNCRGSHNEVAAGPDWRNRRHVNEWFGIRSLHASDRKSQNGRALELAMLDDTIHTARDLADRFDLKRSGRSWRGNCPACRYEGTFSVREGRSGQPLLWCASCQDYAAIAQAIGSGTVASLPPVDREREAKARANKQERALALWSGARPVADTPAELYLIRRGIAFLSASPALRFRGITPHPTGESHSALLALVSDPKGEALAIHRTYLRADGTKAKVDPSKASLGPIWGSAIRLSLYDPDGPLVVGEGIETAASAGHLMGLPAWAAISAGNLAKGLVLPREVGRVIIAADPDQAGRDAARAAWLRWKAEGREVKIALPTGDGDFNDLLCRRAPHGG